MKQFIKIIRCYFLIIIPLINVYIFRDVIFSLAESTNREISQEKNPNEFLILDWTATNHIFQESDRIICNFSSYTFDNCQRKFFTISDEFLREHLIEKCSYLSNIEVRWTKDRSRLEQANLISFHSQQIPIDSFPRLTSEQFSMVYTLESEAYTTSSISLAWKSIDFAMWYNLERSYPEPATYFDVLQYLKYLFSPIQIPFEQKIPTTSTVWISSNCRTYNGRERFIQELMSYIQIDSFGNCLNNRISSTRRPSAETNAAIYSSYKFVLVIENSNCEDYVTEKLIEAFASTSIPIVASRNHLPDYRRFAPKSSFINIYDFPSAEELAFYLHYLSTNRTAYEEYLWFRQKPEHFSKIDDYFRFAEEIFGSDSMIYKWLLSKETNTNKYCKLIRFLFTNDRQTMSKHWRRERPSISDVCLPKNDLIKHFNIS